MMGQTTYNTQIASTTAPTVDGFTTTYFTDSSCTVAWLQVTQTVASSGCAAVGTGYNKIIQVNSTAAKMQYWSTSTTCSGAPIFTSFYRLNVCIPPTSALQSDSVIYSWSGSGSPPPPPVTPVVAPVTTPVTVPVATPVARPVATPIVSPTASPTASPTPLPTSLPTVQPTWGRSSVFFSLHSDLLCAEPAYSFLVPHEWTPNAKQDLVLDKCHQIAGPDNGASVYSVVHCSLQDQMYSLKRSYYGASDSTCSQLVTSQVVLSHQDLCRWDWSRQGYARARCGEDGTLFALKKTKAWRMQKYADSKCKSVPVASKLFLGVCTPHFQAVHKGSAFQASFFYRVESYEIQPWATALNLVLFDKKDPGCNSRPRKKRTLTVYYNSTLPGVVPPAKTQTCFADPLHNGLFYKTTDTLTNVLANVPTPEPTTVPTPQPTAPTASPTVSPTAAPTFSPTLSPTVQTVVSNGLVLSLDAATYSGSGNWVDSVGGYPFGFPNGVTKSTAGGGSLSFSSSSSQYAASSTSPALSVWTIESWVSVTDGTGVCPSIVAEVQGTGPVNYVLGLIKQSDKLYYFDGYFTGTNWITSGNILGDSAGGAQADRSITTMPTGWTQLVGTYDGSNLKLYLNGELKLTTSASNTQSSSGLGMRLMRRWDAPDYVGGNLAIVRMYNRALSAAEVAINYAGSAARFVAAT